jgi:stage IV sporulation protein FB
MFGTAETPYDLRFRFLGIPVRIHPIFWLVSAVLGWRDHQLSAVALWVVCVLVSILVHEYGHALVAKAFDCSPSIVLWGLGGLCYSQAERQSPGQRLAVVLAGPGAGFLLLALVFVVTALLSGITPPEQMQMIGALFGLAKMPPEVSFKIQAAFHLDADSSLIFLAYWYLVQINLIWGLVNLLPMWPLDGGQATQILISHFDRSKGQRWTHIVSLLVSGVLAVMAYSLTNPPDLFLTLFFGYFAFLNFQILQTIHQAQTMGLYQEDEWWRR